MSESSDESSGTSTSTSSNSAFLLKLWEQWRPGPYCVVCATTATVAALLFPSDAYEIAGQGLADPAIGGQTTRPITEYVPCHLLFKLVFVGLVLASFGCGFVAAFLINRAAGASLHASSACGFAIVNWFESMLGVNELNAYGCRYGFLTNASLEIFSALRLLLYLIGSLWMQVLVVSRIKCLEQSSKQSYCSGCLGSLLWVQVFATMMAGLATGLPLKNLAKVTRLGKPYQLIYVPIMVTERRSLTATQAICSYLFFKADSSHGRHGHRPLSMTAPAGAVAFAWLCNVIASGVAICSLIQSFIQLRRVSRIAAPVEKLGCH